MKSNALEYIKTILSDRLLTVLIVVLLLLVVAYAVYVGVSLRPSDLQVAVHYTAFGEASFYRDKWYYFANFILFALLTGVAHSLIVVKLYIQERRHMALLFAYLSIFLVIIIWLLTAAVLRIAFL
jgi:hypothetical protein